MANGRLIQYFCVALLFFACNPVPVSAGGFGFFKRNATDVKNDVPLKPSSARKAPPPQPAPPVNYTVAPTGVVVAAKGSASGVNGKSNSPSSLSTSKGTGTYGEPKRPALPVPTEYPQVLAEMTNQVITDGNFTTLTEGIWLVQLYAPWCHHSRKLQTIWPDIVKSLHSKNTSINFAKVDGTKDTKAAAFFEIKGYPTIKFIQNGSVWTYREQIIVDHVINFVQEGWRQQLWYNRPKSWSIWFKVQLDIFNALMGYKFFWERQLLAFETSFRSMFILLGLLGAGMFFVNDKLGGQNTGINVPAMDNEIIAGAAVENAGLEEFQQEQVLDGSNVVFQDNIPRDLSVLQESFASQHNDAVIIEHDKAYNDDSNQLYVDEICQPTVDSSANPALGYAHEPGASKEEHESTGISVVSMLFERSDIVTDFQTTVNISEEVVSSDQSSCMTAQREDEVTLCGEETAEQTRRAEKEDDGVSLGSCSERASVHIETGSAGTVSASEESASLREEPQSASAHAEGTSIVEIADQIRDYLSVDTRSIRTHRSAGSPSSMFEQVDIDYLELEEEEEEELDVLPNEDPALFEHSRSLEVTIPVDIGSTFPTGSLPSPSSFVQPFEVDYLEIEEEHDESVSEVDGVLSQEQPSSLDINKTANFTLYSSFESNFPLIARQPSGTPKAARDSGVDLDTPHVVASEKGLDLEMQHSPELEPTKYPVEPSLSVAISESSFGATYATAYVVEEEVVFTTESTTEEVWFIEGEEVVEVVEEVPEYVVEEVSYGVAESLWECDGVPVTPSTDILPPVTKKLNRKSRKSNLSLRFSLLAESEASTPLLIPTTPEPRSPSRLISPTSQIPIFLPGYSLKLEGKDSSIHSSEDVKPPTSPGRFDMYGPDADLMEAGRFLHMAGR